MNYNTIIIGSGAAGGILAARLSEDPTRTVLLLEAGPDFPTVESLPEEVRYAFGRDLNLWGRAFGAATRFGWGYTAQATPQAKAISIPRGKLVGGSSAVNANIFLRGVPEDYDSWAAAGNDRWSFAQLLPSFCKNERDVDFQDSYHGSDGLIPAWRVPRADWAPEHAALYESARAAGYADCPDCNAPDSTGVGAVALNHFNGTRWSTAITYLQAARPRKNLTIQADSLVHRILFEGRRAVGVSVEHQGALSTIYADEIIVSGGAIASPHLLLHSGVGPADALRRLDIPLVQHLPGVGQNLRDHPQVQIIARLKPELPVDRRIPRLQTILRYTATGSTLRNDMILLPSSLATADGVMNDAPPVGFYFVPAIYLAVGAGEVTLTSRDPHVQPALNYNYLAEPFDLQRMREGVRLALDLMQHDSFRAITAELLIPSAAEMASDAVIDAWMLRTVMTSHHSSSTCKMGPASDPLAVVDQFGKVHGLEGLRVADASIMPDCIRANTNVTSMAIGERIAELMGQGF